jgi:hypothetical protein
LFNTNEKELKILPFTSKFESEYHLSLVSFQRNCLVAKLPLRTSMPAFSVGVPDVKFELRVIMLSANRIVSVLTVVVVPLTVKLPVTTNVVPSKVRLLSTVAFGAVPFKVIRPLFVVPVNDSNPLEPDVPRVPLEPLLPLEPEEPDEPEVPLVPLEPLLTLEPEVPLVPLEPL